ncbi:hypothetical protein [Euzebya tangerina]|uniref:hypothetical protein n=1 Tax=Euzebya tangerina TaxID=591198 RepID=UPI000E323F5D|nr:hypothetical protein [Euzebya tangerina]
MSGPAGVMSVILLQTAVGGAVVLWAGGVWGEVRRGFFLLTGVFLVLCAAGAWALVGTGAGATSTALAAFTGLLVVWQVLLVIGQQSVSRWVGLVAAAAGVVTLPLFATLRDDAVIRGLAELALGAIFLGSAFYGLLLGHWYLVERRLSNSFMVNSARWFAGGTVAAAVAAGLSAMNPIPADSTQFSPFLQTDNFTVLLAGGLVAICFVIAAFLIRLTNEGGRSIQAATGYFYLAVIMAFSAELASKFRFFV